MALRFNTVTLAQMRSEVLLRLQDTDQDTRIWSDAEIESYVEMGYRELTRQARCLWDIAYLEDLPYTATHDYFWEDGPLRFPEGGGGYFPSGWLWTAPGDHDFDWEADFQPNGTPAANHTYPWERTYIQVDYISATVRAPMDFYDSERVTWNWMRCEASSTMDLQLYNSRYEVQRGRVVAYSREKDGLYTFRKWMPPYTRASTLTVFGTFGALRACVSDFAASGSVLGFRIDEFRKTAHGVIDGADRARFVSVGFQRPGTSQFASPGGFPAWPELSTEKVVPPDTFASPLDPLSGTSRCFGVARIIPGHHPMQRPWGLPRRVYFDENNTRLEYVRRGHDLSVEGFELPDWYTTYVRHYALAKALERDGPGQDMKLAQHFTARFSEGVARLKTRTEAAQSFRLRSMGPSKTPNVSRVGPPSLPWNYGGEGYWSR